MSAAHHEAEADGSVVNPGDHVTASVPAPQPSPSCSWRWTSPAVPAWWLLVGAVLGAALAALGTHDRSDARVYAVGIVVAVVGVVVGTVDVRERRIPNALVLVTLSAAAVIALVALVAEGESVFAGAGAAGLIAGLPLLTVHLVSPRGMGFGDVKYGAVLGALLGVLDWRLAVVAVTVASFAGGLTGLAYAPWRRSIPFGLFLSLGAAVAVATAGLQP